MIMLQQQGRSTATSSLLPAVHAILYSTVHSHPAPAKLYRWKGNVQALKRRNEYLDDEKEKYSDTDLNFTQYKILWTEQRAVNTTKLILFLRNWRQV